MLPRTCTTPSVCRSLIGLKGIYVAGHFPIKLEALPEGTCCHVHVPVFQVATPVLQTLQTRMKYQACCMVPTVLAQSATKHDADHCGAGVRHTMHIPRDPADTCVVRSLPSSPCTAGGHLLQRYMSLALQGHIVSSHADMYWTGTQPPWPLSAGVQGTSSRLALNAASMRWLQLKCQPLVWLMPVQAGQAQRIRHHMDRCTLAECRAQPRRS